jgi:DivIVA domain-containing protein
MDGSPQLLTDVKFTQLRKGGYDPEEVDNYLERINDAVAKLADKLRAATEQSEAAQAQLAEARRGQSAAEAEVERLQASGGAPPVPADEELAKVLVLAQRAADQAIDEANATATKTVADARAKSVNLLAEAEQERERLMVKAHKKADAAAEERARELKEQVDALAAARADLEADVEALRAHLDGERDRLRERVDSMRAALDDPPGLRLTPTPELHDTPIPEVDLPGLADPTPVEAETPASEVEPVDESATEHPDAADEAQRLDASGIDDGERVFGLPPLPDPPADAEVSRPVTDTVSMPAVSPLSGPEAAAESSRPHPELVPLVAPEEADTGIDEGPDATIYLDEPAVPSGPETKQVEAQLFAGDPVAENRSFVESADRPPGDLFGRDEDSPLGEPDEQADAAMRAFFERDLDDPSIAGRGRFGRRR